MAPPPTTAPTILSLKQTFLTTQTRLLSQPPEPSRAWRRGNNSHHPSSQGGDDEEGRNHQKLSEKALNDALYRLNHTLQQHARRVYAPQATRHVAEQIDQLYLGVGERRRRGGDENGDGEGGDEDEVEGEGDAWKMVGADYGEWPLSCHSSTIFSFFGGYVSHKKRIYAYIYIYIYLCIYVCAYVRAYT